MPDLQEGILFDAGMGIPEKRKLLLLMVLSSGIAESDTKKQGKGIRQAEEMYLMQKLFGIVCQ